MLDTSTAYFYWLLVLAFYWSASGALNLAFLNASSLVPLFAFSVLSR